MKPRPHPPARPHGWLRKVMMPRGGFIKPTNIGPGWLEQCRPPSQDLLAVLALPAFENVFPAHGTPVLGGAQQKFRPALELAARS